MLQILFDVHVAVPERRLGLTLRRPQRSAQLVRGPHDAHPAAAAAGHGLDDHGIANVPGRAERAVLAFTGPSLPGSIGQPRLLHRPARAGLVAEQPDDIGVRADERDLACPADLGEVRALREEAITGMNGVGARDLRGADDRRHVQIAVGAPRRPDADLFVREAHVQRVFVRLRIDGDRLDAELPARQDDADGDFAPIGDQDLLEHGWLRDQALRAQGSGLRLSQGTGPRPGQPWALIPEP